MAQEGEWLQNRAENWSQAVKSFHRCPPLTFSAESHRFAFPTSKWGLPAFQEKGFMWPNSSNFAPLQVVFLGCPCTLLWIASGMRASPGYVCWIPSPTVPTDQTEGRHGHLEKPSPPLGKVSGWKRHFQEQRMPEFQSCFPRSPAVYLCVNQPTSVLGICTVPVSLAGISSAPAIQVQCRLAKFVAAVSVRACASSRGCSPPWLEGLTQVSFMIPFIWRAPWVTCRISSHLLPSPDQPLVSGFYSSLLLRTCDMQKGLCATLALWFSGSDPLLVVMGEIFTCCSDWERLRSLQRVFEPLVC